MSQKNMGRLAQDMKREIIAIIGRLKDPRLEGGLLTVTRLDVTPDLDVAKVYVSVMGREDGPKPAIEALNRAAGHVRTEVSKKMHIRKAPRFIFVEDLKTIDELLLTGGTNVYTIDKQGIKKMIYQTAWFKDGVIAGLVEISMEIPTEMPHYVRG